MCIVCCIDPLNCDAKEEEDSSGKQAKIKKEKKQKERCVMK